MGIRRNALLLFSKFPEAGKVKTRLTPLKDGFFDPETACALYRCMLLDVVDICCDALSDLEACGDGDAYELVVSSPGAAQRDAMRELLERRQPARRGIRFIADVGDSFDAHYNDAFSQVWASGFDTVLSLGCDMPALRRSIVVEGFGRLHALCGLEGGGIVVAPDQEMGVSVVGWTRETRFDHTGVFYNEHGLTVLPAYIGKAAALGLPALYLPDVPDVDTVADLYHNATLVQALAYCARFQDDVTAPARTAAMLADLGFSDVRVLPNELRDDRSEIDR